MSDMKDQAETNFDKYVGKPLHEVMDRLKSIHGSKLVEEVEQGAITTAEYVKDRVRVWFHPETKKVTDVSKE